MCLIRQISTCTEGTLLQKCNVIIIINEIRYGSKHIQRPIIDKEDINDGYFLKEAASGNGRKRMGNIRNTLVITCTSYGFTKNLTFQSVLQMIR